MNDSVKKCTKCGLILPESSFSKGGNQCKACLRAYWQAYEKTDKRKVQKKAYQQTDKYKAYMKAYQQTDKFKAYKKAYVKTHGNTDKRKVYMKAYQQTDKFKAYKKAYVKTHGNTDKRKVYMKAYQHVYLQSNSYFNSLIRAGTPLRKEDVPQELIKLKRLEIQIKRELRNEH